MTLGLIARANNAGLGTLTWEVHRHLHPAKTLIVHTDHPGHCHPERFNGNGEVRCTPAGPTARDTAWLLDGISTVYSAETWYRPRLFEEARHRGVRTVLHVMPEYYKGQRADILAAPTSWKALRRWAYLPVPVARDRLPVRTIEHVETLYHIASPSMDRNGTRLLLAALEHCREWCTVVIRGGSDRPEIAKIGRVMVKYLPRYDGPYYKAWPDDVQALVMPRRFAGLSLPMQEAASLGLPVICLNRDPEREWFPAATRVPATVAGTKRLTRGASRTDIYTAQPRDVARCIDALVATRALAKQCAADSAAHGDELVWADLLPIWERVLGYAPRT